jgi:hypothetical protein
VDIRNPEGISIGNYSLDYHDLDERYYLNHSLNRSGIYTFTIWASDTSNNWASTNGSLEIEEEKEPDEYNWKPLIAILFAIILLIIGIIIVMIKPMKFTGDLGRDRTYSFFAGVVPFVVAEAITGIISFFTGLLAVPPIFGVGMIVDLAILIVGIICSIIIYVKGVSAKNYDEEIFPSQTGSQSQEKTLQLDAPKPPLPDTITPAEEPPSETPPPLPAPESEKEEPPAPPSDEEKKETQSPTPDMEKEEPPSPTPDEEKEDPPSSTPDTEEES